MATTIEISYRNNPPGQIGDRPRKVTPGTEIQFTTKDGTDLVVDFMGKSPLSTGAPTAKQNEVVTIADKPGRYPFKCTLTVNGKPVALGDPANPGSGIGGELDVGH